MLERRMKETRLNSKENQESKREKGEGRNMIAEEMAILLGSC